VVVQSFVSFIPVLNILASFSNIDFTKRLYKFGIVSVSESLNEIGNSKRLLTTIIFYLLKTLFIVIFSTPFIILSILIAIKVNETSPELLLQNPLSTFWLISILVLSIGIILVESLTFPALYLLSNNCKLSLTDTIKKSITIAKNGITTYLALIFIYGISYLIFIIVYIFLILVAFLSRHLFFTILALILIGILILLVIIFTPLFIYIINCSIYMLVDDLNRANNLFQKNISNFDQEVIIEKYKLEIINSFNHVDKINLKLYNKLKRKCEKCIFSLDSLKYNFDLKSCELISIKYRKIEYKILQKNRKKLIMASKIRKNKTLVIFLASMLMLVSGVALLLGIGSIPCVQYATNDQYATVTGVKGLLFPFYINSPIKIKSEVDGVPVKVIGVESFAYSDIKSITLPESIVTIDKNAFEGCSKLKEVNTYIDGEFYENRINCLYINSAAFSNCESLDTLYITKRVEKIAYNAFVKSPDIYIIYAGTPLEWDIVSSNIYYCEILFECNYN
jgi:hypothetical protein